MNPWRFWFELAAAFLIGVAVLTLLGPLVAAVYGLGALGFLNRRRHRHRHHH